MARAEPVDDDRDFDPPEPPEIRRSATALRLVMALLGLIGVGIVAALGGFERVEVYRGLPTVAEHEALEAGDWVIAVDDAVAGLELRGLEPEKDGNYLVEVDVTMTNVGQRTNAVFHRLELEENLNGLVEPDPRYIMIRDNGLASYLQPDLPERVAFVWEFKAGTPVPDKLHVTLVGYYVRKTSFAILNSDLPYDEPAGTVDVAVTNRTGTR